MRCADCDGILGECGCERRSTLHVDGTIAAANRAIELQAENEQLKAQLASLTVLVETSDYQGLVEYLRDSLTLRRIVREVTKEEMADVRVLMKGLRDHLPDGTPSTVDGIVGAVADMALKLDAHEDASTPAFDEIVKLCGLAKTWDYPAQVVRDVDDTIKRKDAKIEEIREERTADLHVMSRQGALIEELRTRLRVAEAVRDDAREASALDLEKRRDALEIAEACREDQRALAKRRDELLATIARLSNTVPFPDEWKDWESTRAKLVAEVGTLRSRVTQLEADLHTEKLAGAAQNKAGTAFAYSVESTIRELTSQKDDAYGERDRCVAALAALAVRLGWSAWRGRHEPDPKWDQDWMNIVFIHLPTGQVSWHIHDSELPWFSFLKDASRSPDHQWDGHTTPQKYERLGKLRDWIDIEAMMGEDGPDTAEGMRAILGLQSTACGCSEKYRELAPGVHAKYCPLSGQPLRA